MDNREKLLETALHLFYTKGYDAVGVQEIVNEVGLTKPTLYYYFGSKLGLLKSLLEEKFFDFTQKLEIVCYYNGDLTKTLQDVTKVYFKFAIEEKELYFFSIALTFSAKNNESYQAMRPYIVKQYSMIVRIFENAKYQLGNMNGRQEQFASSFIGSINNCLLAYFEKWEDKNSGKNVEKEIYSITHQFMHGIYS